MTWVLVRSSTVVKIPTVARASCGNISIILQDMALCQSIFDNIRYRRETLLKGLRGCQGGSRGHLHSPVAGWVDTVLDVQRTFLGQRQLLTDWGLRG